MIGTPPPRGVGGPRMVVIDAGKSTVRAAVFAGERVLARHCAQTGFPHPDAPGAQGIVLERVQEILRPLQHGPYDVMVLATTGVRAIGTAELELQAALAQRWNCEALVANDVVAAYLGALGPSPGVLVQAGTGSLVLGVAEGQAPVRLDGWGPLAGDRGGGFALGRAGLRAAYAALDGTGPPTALTTQLTDPDPEQAIRGLYASSTPIKDVAARARTVLRTAADGDQVALDVASTIATELVDMILAAGRRLGDPQLHDLPVTSVGGLFADHLFANTVAKHLREHRPAVQVLRSAGDALDGGRLLATTRDDPITRLLTCAFRNEDP